MTRITVRKFITHNTQVILLTFQTTNCIDTFMVLFQVYTLLLGLSTSKNWI